VTVKRDEMQVFVHYKERNEGLKTEMHCCKKSNTKKGQGFLLGVIHSMKK
jgi:hypothetical protein